MARTQEYIITIRTEATQEAAEKGGKKAPSSATTKEGGKVSKNEKSAGQKLTQGVIRSAAFNYAKRAIGMVSEAQIGTIQLRTGQVQYQEQQQALYGYVQQGLSIAESVAMGYAVGNVYGAVISGVASIVSKVANIGIESSRLGMQKTIESIGRDQAMIRAGASGGRTGKTY